MSSTTPDQMSKFFEKLDQLRALVAFGQQAMPFIEDLFSFIRDVAPLMEDINASLRDSTGKIPRATNQIQSVSQATELATTEILDLVDSVLQKLSSLEERLTRSSEHAQRVAELDDQLIALLRRELGGERDDLLEEVERLHAEKRQVDDTTGAEVAAERELLEAVRREANQIMMSLQVQDITSQQLSAVNHLIESIHTHLSQLLRRLENDEWDEEAPEAYTDDDGTFNPDAVYDPSGRLQHAADAVADAYHSGTAPPEDTPTEASSGDGAAPSGPASQDDIDDLFAQQSAPTPPDEAPAANADDGPASQDDIDKLFENGF